ncbi:MULTISPECIES: DUF11 domain-containing protein [unclassified Nocardioides]|uniref:DUF11 domain-containing protein n=1 Tax=unclassified Nocardioides TaxID=2615069 RepID=UPI0006FED398|nr:MULTISPECIES: DUF11 domain-containing protein [unclassified Nocardioides]KRA29554.1 hypothetical protein ASD81_21520 [Nocardioides sp. Root614]KRA88271.1 hypothetical protein ASD84_20095 [Nocardioides sp. Root682]
MKSKRLTAVALVCAVSPVVVLPALVSGALPSPAAHAAAAALPPESRVAFTDERDQVYSRDVTLSTFTGSVSGDTGTVESLGLVDEPELGYVDRPVHEGELSKTPGESGLAWVSTKDTPEGEVYHEDSDGGITRVTCDNDDLETHPVPGTDGDSQVFFASDADGDWDIYAAIRSDDGDCNWTITNLTPDSPGDDLWPSPFVTEDFDGGGTFGIVYSTAEEGRLPDLALISFQFTASDPQWDGDPGAFDAPVQLTPTPGYAETQPAVAPDLPDAGLTVAYTSNEDTPEGSIRLLEVFNPSANWDPWTDEEEPPASSEAAWVENFGEIYPYLAYTRREEDPYGDIATARYDPADSGNPEPHFFRNNPVFTTPGVAETHPVWLDGFTGGSTSDTSGEIAYTARALHTNIDPTDSRVLDADISDVRVDGTERTRVVDEIIDDEIRVDEAGPDYSPDGGRIAFSRQVGVSDSITPLEREIWTADTDGANAESLATSTGHTALDRDRDPVWSPDGTRIAFVRERRAASTASTATSTVYVVDLAAQTTIMVTPPLDFDAEDPELDHRTWEDSDPDWSPDGTQLILRRTTQSCCNPDPGPFLNRPAPGWTQGADRLPARGETLPINDDSLWVVPVETAAIGVRVRTCPEFCDYIIGRHPAWAPDGSAIVFVNSGALVLGTIQENSDDDFLVETEGITRPFWDGNTTESQATLAWADEPAWAPDSSEISFSGQPMGQPDQRGIYRILPDATGLAVITDERGPETEPTYQPTPRADVAVTAVVTGSPASVGGPLTATYTVTNLGPQTALGVVLTTTLTAGATIISATTTSGPPVTCAADGTGCTIPSLPMGEPVTYVVTFSHPVPVAAGTATAIVTTSTVDPAEGNNTATATYQVMLVAPPKADLAVFLGLDSPTGYVGGHRIVRVRVRNLGPQAAQAVQLTATWPDGVVAAIQPPALDPPLPPLQVTPACLPGGLVCNLGNIPPGTDVLFAVALTTATEGDFTLAAKVSATTIDPALPNNQDTIELPVLQPAIRLVPAVARPGQVVLAYGENMPPGTEVVLSWDEGEGVPIDPGPLTVLDDGTIRRSLLILRREQLGGRTITATSTTEEFTPVTGDILVVLRSLSPPDLVGRG